MFKALVDFTISVNGWDNTAFRKGEVISCQKLGARCVELGVAEKVVQPKNIDVIKPEKNTSKDKPLKTK